jgi:hypothetical protein
MSMGKKTTQQNFRVVIEPRGLGNFGSVSMSDRMFCKDEADRQRQYRELCEEIAQDVKRHVDNVGWVGVESDDVHECEHCHSTWTEESAEYNGGCCDKDQEAEEQRQKAKTDELMDSLGFPSIRKGE